MVRKTNQTCVTFSLLLLSLWEFVTILYSSSAAQAGGGRENVIPFWNIAAKRKAAHQYRHQHLTVETNNRTVDYCMAASISSSSSELPRADTIFHRSPHPVATTATTTTTTLQYRGGQKETIATTPIDSTDITITDITINGRIDEGYKPLNSNARKLYEFSLFQKGDGSDEDIDGIPTRYLLMQNHNRILAKEAVHITLQWRKEHQINTILQRPQPYYDIAKAVFPHYFVAARDTMGHVIFVQRPALLNLQLATKNNLNASTLLGKFVRPKCVTC
jgi:hypothetical protein